jgi:nicotinamide riboside kinase
VTSQPAIISITGPECSGKTTLALSLAMATDAVVVTEYARDFLNEHGKQYNINDLIIIARRQFALMQDAVLQAQRTGKHLVICDTDMTVMRIWAEEKFGMAPQEILDLQIAESFDLILLCDPRDIDWEPDPLRENPYDRQRLFDRYCYHYDQLRRDYKVVQGNADIRLQRAMELLRN